MTPEPIPPAPRKLVNANVGPRRPSARRDAPGLECSSQFRCHHLIKTFCAGWTDQQLPDGTVIRVGYSPRQAA